MTVTHTHSDKYSQHYAVASPDREAVTVINNVADGWVAVLYVHSKRSSYPYKRIVSKHPAINAAKAFAKTC
jgi:hypothetical protein